MIWTKEAVEQHGGNFQRMVKEEIACQIFNILNQLELWQVRRNQSMAFEKFNAKKAKRGGYLLSCNALYV